jgi:FHS family glucose/mannose:H+ symporter-like MFS transporter
VRGALPIPDTIAGVIPVVVRQRSAAFALGCWAFVLIGWSSLVVPALAREVEAGFAQTDVGLGLFYFVTAAAYAAGSILGGMAIELVGRRLILSTAMALLSVGLIAQGATDGWGVFIAAGVVRSLGAGALDGGGNGMVIDLYQGARGGRLNLLHLFFSLGALGAPFVLAGRDLVGLSWQAVVIVSGLVALPLAAALALTDLADGRARPALAADGRRSSLLALPLFILALAIACYVACEIGVSSWLVRFLADAPAATATTALGLFWAGLAAGRLVGSRFADRFDHLQLAIGASLACGAAIVAAVVVPSLAASIALFVVVGFASGPIFPLIVAVGGERFPDRASAVSGLIVAASVVGGVAYPPLMGVMSVTVGLPVAMFGTAVVAVGCAVALAFVGRLPAPRRAMAR